MQRRPRKHLVTKLITVPGNLQRACDDFNAGRFYESHEYIEEIWQCERGVARDAYKGLIQVAAAFVHLSRGKYPGAERLLRTALGYLEPYREDGAVGFDIDEIATTAEDVYRRLVDGGRAKVAAFDLGRRPVYVFNESRLRADAIRDRLWGFDGEGNATEMEITVAEVLDTAG